ncbi:ABC transporter ATP-binding protein [Ancylobacter dichloromethanicus]|uniref:ABC transporter ATP-binding protein n=1 Tax=Ancylobacter dichloromethanicus TaxID=518825 RepID=A0A9W6N178_9HYPH|nr:ABC transporter ATP-binding protein [Ancylobacter dichloromethanicus]MBS7552182.1 ABC transporter ATP-binding protein [Ancylobacter dichloromethanicus]GLK73916.1 ABC transporter ATP-binding protein [Ancylobacter dichloromethanicus]
MSSIAFVSVSKRYGDVDAVKAFDLSCAPGEMLALLGPSGCGKSTTLKMAAGIESVSSGEIYFGDRPVSGLAPGARNIAMVFEDYALYPRMSVWENVAFPLKVRGITGQPAAQRIGEVLQLLGLRQMAEQDVSGLSGGAQQRVAIGRALVRDPEVILFDEPLSHLDADQKVQLRAEIKRLQKLRQVTSILVTHDQTEAIAMADRVAVMNHGVLQQVGAPQDLYERPANLFVANFIGEPPMNLMKAAFAGGGRVVGGGWSATPDAARLGVLTQGEGAIIAGIRPEHVAVNPPEMPGEAQGVIVYREPRGDADVLTVALGTGDGGGEKLIAEIPGPSPWRAGDRVSLGLDVKSLLIFDAATTRNREALQ